MNDGFSVDVIEVGEDPRFEFILGRDSNAAKHRSGHLGAEASNPSGGAVASHVRTA
jgi:hypothetical protein